MVQSRQPRAQHPEWHACARAHRRRLELKSAPTVSTIRARVNPTGPAPRSHSHGADQRGAAKSCQTKCCPARLAVCWQRRDEARRPQGCAVTAPRHCCRWSHAALPVLLVATFRRVRTVRCRGAVLMAALAPQTGGVGPNEHRHSSVTASDRMGPNGAAAVRVAAAPTAVVAITVLDAEGDHGAAVVGRLQRAIPQQFIGVRQHNPCAAIARGVLSSGRTRASAPSYSASHGGASAFHPRSWSRGRTSRQHALCTSETQQRVYPRALLTAAHEVARTA